MLPRFALLKFMRAPARLRLDLAGESYALIPSGASPCSNAVIFVHGFGGHSEKTWLQFQTLPDRLGDSWWRDSDLFFYSYDSTCAQLWPNIELFRSFLSGVFPQPRWSDLGYRGVARQPTYQNVIIVGHSEGAVIARGALLEVARQHADSFSAEALEDRLNKDKILKAGVCCFAPALFGALISGWKGVLLRSRVLGGLIQPLLGGLAAYQQLQADQPVLKQIREETKDRAEQYPSLAAFRAHNLFAAKDDIVNICRLPTDFICEYELSKTHTSICKPSTNYIRPVTFIRDVKHAIAA
jgi:hypothetical protein